MDVTLEYLVDRPEAVPQIAAWWFGEWGYRNPSDTLELLTDRLRGQLSRDTPPIQVVAVADGGVVGAAVLKPHEMIEVYPDKKYWLGSVYVAAHARGQGIASTLVLRIIEIARSLGVPALHLQTFRLDGGLYARLGWDKFAQVQYRGDEVAVMVRRIDE